MLVPVLVIAVVVLGVFVYYLYFLAPKWNPRNKAEQFLSSNKIEEAIIEYRRVIENYPMDVKVHNKLAGLYLKQDKIDQAVTHLERIVEINLYNSDVEKIDIFRLLAGLYLKREEYAKAFEKYYELLRDYPSDKEALYHVGFMALGQEIFDTAYRNLELLAKLENKNFEILFGAGIAALQSQRTTESIALFRDALALEPHSDIANLAMAFALYKKRDYKTSINYAKMVNDNSSDENALFIVKRLLAFLYVEVKKTPLTVKFMEELKEQCISNNWETELQTVLYDLGFAYLMDDKTEQTYNYWSQLYQLNRGYTNIQDFITRLRKEMDTKPGSKFEETRSVLGEIQQWKEKAFPDNFLWDICGLKSPETIELAGIISAMKTSGGRERKSADTGGDNKEVFIDFDDYYKLDAESFRSISYRMCEKMGFVIDDILATYREADGVDFMAHTKDTKIKTLIWVRRWKGTVIGEIPLRNFAQAVNDLKAKQGYFITTSPLTQAGEAALSNLAKVTVIYPEEVAKMLKGIMV